ncbi:MAG: OmpA family protein [Geminicoccaceae bacterium]
MHCRFLGWFMAVVIAGPGVMMSESIALRAEGVDEQSVFRIVADVSGGDARLIAVGISALARQKIEDFDFDIAWAGFGEDSLDLIRQDDKEFALIDLNQVDSTALAARDDLRAVMKYWPDDQSSSEPSAGPNAGHLLAVKPSVDAELVRAFVAAVETDNIILKASSIDIEKLDPSIAMADLPIPLHQGLKTYAREVGSRSVVSVPPSETSPPKTEAVDVARATSAEEPETSPSVIPIAIKPAQTPIPKPTSGGSRSYTVYFDSNDARLDEVDFKSVARACQYASKLPRAKFTISGFTDTAGSMVANKELAALRAAEVADAIRKDPRFRDALSVMEFGESKPAVETKDGVGEALNRRVLITIATDE